MKKFRKILFEILLISVGCGLFGLGFSLFLEPAGMNAGGLSGLAMVIYLPTDFSGEIDLATTGPLAGKTFETWADGPAGPRDVQKDVRPVKDGRLKLSLAAGGGFAGILR